MIEALILCGDLITVAKLLKATIHVRFLQSLQRLTLIKEKRMVRI